MHITTHLTALITTALNELGLPVPAEIHLEHPADPTHGDYSTNVAMTLFGQLKKNGAGEAYKNPRELAAALVEQLKQQATETTDPTIADVTLAGPGFINLTLSQTFLINQLKEIVEAGQPSVPQLNEGKKVIVEFTDPNPFKEFHIGHLYSNTVGESVSRLFEATGAHVYRACYQGDVGMHVAKSVWGMKQKIAQEKLSLQDLERKPLNERIKFLGQAYAMGATAYEEDEHAKQEMKEINFLTFLSAQEHLKETSDWQPQVDYSQYLKETQLDFAEIKELYQKGREWSLCYFDEIYARLGMKFDDFYFESIVGEYGMKIVKEHLKSGTFKESQGAIIFPGSEYGLHDRVFVNSLGLPTYECKELGLVPEKYRRFKYDLSVIITGNEIKEYFKVLLKAIEKTNPELGAKTRHFSHGMVRLPEGKMSSRTGKILTGEWLIEEAKARVKQIFAETKSGVSGSELEDTAEKIALAAIKYALLKINLGRDISFSFDESLSFQGNSGPYLQYTYVRCQSVLEKAAAANSNHDHKNSTISLIKNIKKSIDKYFDIEMNESEKDILRNIYTYNEVIELSAHEFAPHHLCTYLYKLAQAFNTFYNQHQIVDQAQPEKTEFRLALTYAVGQILAHGLQILGIQTVEKM